jgi:hypothetical protein
LQLLVRGGFLARGLTYGLVGVLAIALGAGAGTGGAKPDQQGALALIARAPLGFVAIAAVAVGLLAYACWKLTQAVRGRGPQGGGGPSPGERAANAGGGVVYLIFCAAAVRILAGSGGGGSGVAAKDAAAGVLSWPAGRWLVGAGGVALIAGSAYQAYYALTDRFTRQVKTAEMAPKENRLFRAVGRVGLVARAVVFALCGYFLVQTAVTYDSKNAVGVDGALARLHDQTFGPFVVVLVGAGLLLFAGFSLFEARYRRL